MKFKEAVFLSRYAQMHLALITKKGTFNLQSLQFSSQTIKPNGIHIVLYTGTAQAWKTK